jgi:perosamine synthetase
VSHTSKLALTGGPATIPPGRHRSWPDITPADHAAVDRVLDRGVLAGANAPEITALQTEYADYLGVRYCVATNSGTAALHCAAAAAGVQPGDEVIVPAYTFVASALAMMQQGATVVFGDVDPRTYNLAPSEVARLITPRTRAIMAVAIHGQPADLDEILAIADPRGIPVIEDNAQAHGIRYRGRMTGGIGAGSGTSTNESKNLSAGEGGFFTTNDEDAHLTARRLTVFGEDLVPLEERPFWSHGIGWNYRNQEIGCALARTQLRRLDGYNARAAENAARLTAALSGVAGLIPPYHPTDRGSSYWKYAVQVDPEALGFGGDPRELRDRIVLALRAEGVPAMIWQRHPVPAQPTFRRAAQTWHPRAEAQPLRPWRPTDYPVASRLCDVTLSLSSERHPLYVQDPALMDAYARACHKVLTNLPAVLRAPAPAAIPVPDPDVVRARLSTFRTIAAYSDRAGFQKGRGPWLNLRCSTPRPPGGRSSCPSPAWSSRRRPSKMGWHRSSRTTERTSG